MRTYPLRPLKVSRDWFKKTSLISGEIWFSDILWLLHSTFWRSLMTACLLRQCDKITKKCSFHKGLNSLSPEANINSHKSISDRFSNIPVTLLFHDIQNKKKKTEARSLYLEWERLRIMYSMNVLTECICVLGVSWPDIMNWVILDHVEKPLQLCWTSFNCRTKYDVMHTRENNHNTPEYKDTSLWNTSSRYWRCVKMKQNCGKNKLCFFQQTFKYHVL